MNTNDKKQLKIFNKILSKEQRKNQRHCVIEFLKMEKTEEGKISKEEFDKALKEGKELRALLMQNPEIAELERAKNKIYRSMVSLSNY